MLGAVGEAADDDARQAVLALEPHEVPLKATMSRIRRPGLCGTISRQFAMLRARDAAPRRCGSPPRRRSWS